MVDKNDLDAAIEQARSAPEDEDTWDELESIAGSLDRPDEVAALYREVLRLDLDKAVLLTLGERAAQFHEDWYSEDTSGLEEVLGRVLEVEPNSASAFQRLTVVYTVAERWDELLAVYNATIDAADDDGRRIRLLDEAAQVAKDVANRPDDAISYLQRLLPLRPDDVKIALNLGRLLERHERWRELIDLWETNLDDLPRTEREAARVRIAACWMDNLDNPEQALASTRPLLAEASDDTEACALLERILAAEDSSAEVRVGALDLLRSHYEGTDRPREVVRVLGAAIERAAPGEDATQIGSLHEEAGDLLAGLGDDNAAMDHYAALLALNPASSVTQEQLRQIAQRSGDYDRYASGVAAAAATCEDISRKVALLGEAARTRLALLDDENGAIELYKSALAQDGLSEADVRTVARRLSELLASAERPAERLDVLERLATVETTVTRRRGVIGEAARLAESLGEADRALAAWNMRIEGDPNDIFALNAMIELLEKEQRWEALIAALNQRVEKASTARERHHDLSRIATVYERELETPDDAIGAWLRVQRECGEDAENIDALANLFSEADRWSDLAELLERVSTPETARVIDRLVRLADAQRHHLGEPDKAAVAYERALSIDSEHEGARIGLTALLEQDAHRARAANALADAYRKTDDWQRYLDLLEPRLAETEGSHARLQILKEAAEIQERQFDDSAAALGSLAQAFPLAPKDRALGEGVMRLAEVTGAWEVAARAYNEAAQRVLDEPFEVAHLRFEEAKILESKLDNAEEAHTAFFAVIGIEPDNLPAVRGVVRIGTRLGRWDEVSAAVVASARARKSIEDSLFNEMEMVAEETGAFDTLVRSLSTAVEQTSDLLPRVAFEIHRRTAIWHRDRRDDPYEAQAELINALSFDADRPDALRDLATLQRANPGPALYGTLRKLVNADPKDLDVLHEAANVAFQHLDDGETTRSALTEILARATAAWRGTAEAHGSQSPESYVSWSVEKLVDHYVETGRTTSAVDLLVDASRLPFDGETRRAMRYRAAAIAAEAGDHPAAIEMYRSVLAQAPDDTESMQKLAELYEAESRFAELLTLRQSELARVGDEDERRFDLRLEISRLVGEVERIGGRLQALRTNLEECPGHAPSVEALCAYLDEKAQHPQLADILEGQAKKLEELERPDDAAGLWERVADIAETHLEDIDRAIAAHRRVVAVAPTSVAPAAALARLYMEREQPAQAVPWFEKHLACVEDANREDVVLRLANAHIGAGHPEQAIACLEGNLSDEALAIPLRSLLLDLYREVESWEPLARLLTKSLPLIDDDESTIAFAREAASIYSDRLEQPDKAIPALEKARSLAPGDREIQKQLAVGLRVAERYGEAREILETLIGDFGRRRSAERAAVHVEVALVAKAEGDREQALKHLKLASKMDVGNARIQRMVAELSLESGELDEAERTFRALLLVVRRQPPGEDETAVGVSEILFELHRIAASRGDEEQANELLESTLEAAVQSDAEVRRLRRSLLNRDEPEILLRALKMRLEASKEKRSQARLLTDVADVLDRALKRSADALDSQLKAVELIPDKIDLHDRARVLAQKASQVERYVDCVESTVDHLRRKKDTPLVAALLMRAGTALEEDTGDLDRALAVYKRAEKTGESTAEACFAIARVAGVLGEKDERSRALDVLLGLALADEPSPDQVDALYRLAEMFVESPERRMQGVDLLRQAFAAEPRFVPAGSTLRKAAQAEPENAEILALYEKVARGSGDWEMQLDFLERRARLPEATPAQVKEAVDLAAAHGLQERGEALLSRAVEAARATDEGIAAAIWAVVALAEQHCETGELAAARDLFFELAEVGDADRVAELGLSIAARAAEADDSKELAAEVYEFLHAREPSARHVWEPLVALYRETGAADRLQATIAATLPTLVDPAERNALRMQHATHLIENVEDNDGAVEVLRDVLLEDPDHLEAGGLLEDVLRKSDNLDGLADFLWQRFEDAKERRNPETVADVARRLGGLLDEMEAPEAATVYLTALEIAPESRDILSAVIDHLHPETDPRERALLMERLLAVESEEQAPALTLELCALWESAEDEDGVQRALELGHRANPFDSTIRQRLEVWYRDHQLWQPLAEMMAADAERLEDAALVVSRLREAAEVYKDMLGDLGSAATLLRRAWEARPTDETLVSELVACLVAAEAKPDAIQVVTETLENDLEGGPRVNLLLQRADLHLDTDNGGLAVQDLEEAYLLDRDEAGPRLILGLERHRSRSEEHNDRDAERAATLRLAELITSAGAPVQARELVTAWVEREPADRDALYFLRDMDTAAEQWEGVIAACSRLTVVEEGPEQIDAALRLAEAAEKSERPDAALRGLELVHEAQPDSALVRDQLRRIYELTGSHRELAGLLVADAEHAEEDDIQYTAYRRAAELFLTSLGDPTAAVDPAEKARALRPDDHDSTTLYADVLTAAGRTEEAIALLEPAIAAHRRRSPKLAALQQRMARIMAASGDRDGHLAWLKKAFDVDRKNGEIASELAQLSTEMGDYDLALKALRAITLMENPGPITRVMALLWEAKIEYARGNNAKAELWAKKALREDPNFTEAQEFLEQDHELSSPKSNMPDEAVLYRAEDTIGVITLNRPNNRNGMTPELLDAFAVAVNRARELPDLRCVVITGEGNCFCSGADFKSTLQRSEDGRYVLPHERSYAMYEPFLSVLDIEVPVIGALNGHTVGGGLGLALMCDIRIGNREAKFGGNFARLGLHSGLGITYLMPRLVGVSRAAELLFTGRVFLGDEAHRIGLVSEAVAADQVMPRAMEMAREIAANAPIAVRMMKRSMYRALDWDVRKSAYEESFAQVITIGTEDLKEGIAALLSKRKPEFKGK